MLLRIAAVAILFSSIAVGQDMKADLQHAQEFQNTGKLEEAWALFCRFEDVDPSAKASCNMLTNERERSKQRYEEGKTLFFARRYEDARTRLVAVRMGPREAARILLEEIDRRIGGQSGATLIPPALSPMNTTLPSGDMTADLHRAQDFHNSGMLEEAWELFCRYEGVDASAKASCNALTKERDRNIARYEEGKAAFDSGHFEEATIKLKQVRMGRKDAAQLLLAQIPQNIEDQRLTQTTPTGNINIDLQHARELQVTNHLEEAWALFCRYAPVDPGAQATCDALTKERDRNIQRYNEGKVFFEMGDFEHARTRLNQVRMGPVVEAKDLLKQADARMTFGKVPDDAYQLFLANDFEKAKVILLKAAGTSAERLLERILQYEGLMRSAQEAESNGNLALAHFAYRSAAAIKFDGPGDPVGNFRRVKARLEAQK